MNTRRVVEAPLAAVLVGVAACVPYGDSSGPRYGSERSSDAEAEEPSATEEQADSDPEQRAREAEPEPDTGQEAEVEAEAESETDTDSGNEADTEELEAEPAPAPALQSFQGLSGSDGVFDMYINEVYVDEDGVITDGMGTSDRAAEGSEFVIFNVEITNESSSPTYFDWGGSNAYDADGNQYVDDYDAAWAACDEYCNDDLNPGGSAETDVVFEMPEGADIASLELRSDPYGSGSAATIEP